MAFIAQPKDNTLESLLSEGFAALEMRFMALDRDRAGVFTWKTLLGQLQNLDSRRRPTQAALDQLKEIYNHVDADHTGTMNFSEYAIPAYIE